MRGSARLDLVTSITSLAAGVTSAIRSTTQPRGVLCGSVMPPLASRNAAALSVGVEPSGAIALCRVKGSVVPNSIPGCLPSSCMRARALAPAFCSSAAMAWMRVCPSVPARSAARRARRAAFTCSKDVDVASFFSSTSIR